MNITACSSFAVRRVQQDYLGPDVFIKMKTFLLTLLLESSGLCVAQMLESSWSFTTLARPRSFSEKANAGNV